MQVRSAAASVFALLVLAACGQTPQVQPPDEARSTPSAAPEPSTGMRLVGRGRAVVAVPQTWAIQETHCGQTTRDTMYVADRSGRSCLIDHAGIASLEIAGSDVPPSGKVTRTTTKSGKVDGVDVRWSAPTCRTPEDRLCAMSLVVPSEQATFTLRVPKGRGAPTALLAAFRESLAILPTGYTTVPFVEYGMSVDEAQQVVAAVGLESESPDVNFPHYATGTEPPAGTVVAIDEVVLLTIGDG